MAAPPIPRRTRPLTWRAPALLWTPVALALAIGGPALALMRDQSLGQTALIFGAGVYALALLSLGVAWGVGRPPRTRGGVIGHIVVAGGLVSLAAPLVLTRLLLWVGESRAQEGLDVAGSMMMAPLALLLGLPFALVSGIVFAWVALAREKIAAPEEQPRDFQPFR